MARKIVITSGKGGVGKSTLCVGIGMALAKMGLNVLLVDCDIGLNNLDILSGVDKKIYYDVLDVLENRCRPEQALVSHKSYCNLKILPSIRACFYVQIDKQRLKYVIDHLSPKFDYIFLDCPSGMEEGFNRAIFCGEEVLVVSTSHITSIVNANKVISVLNTKYNNKIGLILNRVRGDLILKNNVLKPEKIASTLSVPLCGLIPELDEISICASTNGEICFQSNMSKQSFECLAENIHNSKHIIFDYEKIGGLFKKLKTKLFGRI